MKTFKMFLEDQRTRETITAKEAALIYNKSCNILPLTASLFRISNADTISLGRTGTRVDSSQGGTHLIQEFLMKQPSWSEVPDRAKSIFCANKSTGIYIGGGDDAAYVFPFNNAKCAHIKKDFNVLRHELFGEDFNVKALQDIVLAFGSNRSTSEHEQFKDGLSKLKKLQRGEYESEDDDVLDIKYRLGQIHYIYTEEKAHALFDAVVKSEFPFSLTPNDLGVTTCDVKDLLEIPSSMHEVWFIGQYLSIPKDQFDEFVNEVGLLK